MNELFTAIALGIILGTLATIGIGITVFILHSYGLLAFLAGMLGTIGITYALLIYFVNLITEADYENS